MPFQGQAVPILVGVASWSFTSWQKQKYERKQQELNQITEQIRNFYGPLSGNRLVYNSSYVCVTQCKHVSMHEWLEAAQLLRDAQRIVKWRSFYLKTLHPLDVEAVKLIKDNTHLYYQNETPQCFDEFVRTVSGQVFKMKEWENQMGALEKATEMSEIDYLVGTNIVLHDYEHPDSLTNHVSDVLQKLRERKQELEDGLSDNSAKWGTLAALLSVFANYAS